MSHLILQVVLNDDQTVDEGQKIADGIIEQIKEGVKLGEYISGAYMDLIFQKKIIVFNKENKVFCKYCIIVL